MTAPGAGPDVVSRVGQLVAVGADRVRRGYAAELGISVTALTALTHLHGHGESTAGHLAQGLGLGAPGTTTVIDHLERAGFARRVTHPDDRRVRLVSLTPGGAHAAEWVIEQYTQVLRPVLAGCSAGEVARVVELLQAMAGQLSASVVPGPGAP